MKEKIKAWCIDTAIRMIKTFGQSAAGVFGVTGVLYEVDWILVLATGGSAAVLCFLTNLASFPNYKQEESEDVNIEALVEMEEE